MTRTRRVRSYAVIREASDALAGARNAIPLSMLTLIVAVAACGGKTTKLADGGAKDAAAQPADGVDDAPTPFDGPRGALDSASYDRGGGSGGSGVLDGAGCGGMDGAGVGGATATGARSTLLAR